MAFIPVPNVCQVNLVHTLFDQDVENTQYWLKQSAWSTPDMIDLASAVISEWSTEIMPLLGIDLVFEKVRVRDLTTQIGLGIEQAVNPTVAGSVASPGLPGNVAFCVKKATGYAGRNARGRMYLAGLTESLVSGNEVTTAWRSILLANLADYQAQIEAILGDVTHVHVSRYLNGVPRTVGAYWNVVSFTADTYIDSQRRRLTGRGT